MFVIIVITHIEKYHQGENGEVKPIEWDILNEKGNKYLIISHYILDVRQFDGKTGIYEQSEIRSWLNNVFYNIAFNDKDKDRILLTEVDNSVQSGEYFAMKFINKNTQDKVFLLSIKEANTYFFNDKARKAYGTDYAKNHGLFVKNKESSVWWLRTPCYNNVKNVRYVGYAGGIGFDHNQEVDYKDLGVRPAMWIKK